MTDYINDHKCEECDLPKLVDDGTFNDYGTWTIKSHCQLRSCGLWKYIDGPESTPPVVPPLRETESFRGIDASSCMKTAYLAGNDDEQRQKTQDFDRWMLGNNIALAKIVLSIPDTRLFLVMHLEFAKQAWESLRSYYEPQNTRRVQNIIFEIKGSYCAPDMDVEQWLKDMNRLYASVCSMDSKDQLSDKDFALAIFRNMPLRDTAWRLLFDSLRRRIAEYDSHQPSPIPIRSHEIITAILEETWDRNRVNARIRAEAETKTRKHQRREPDAASTSNASKRRRTLSDKFCTNPHCGVPNGHNFAGCVAYGGGSQGQYGPNWKGLWNIHLPAGQRTKANNVPPMGHPAYAKITMAPH
jgi:hypothetical protein